jgi:LDH2 family malate/lactate/ureidoglycolate dehydrogenase
MPADWAIRKEDGQPTTDPNDYCKGKAVLTPIAGHKGYGLALMVEIMGAVMSGANILKSVNAWTMTPEVPGNTGHFIMALDIAKLQDMATYNATMEAMIDELKSATPIDPARPVLYPGELEKNREAAVAASGKMSISENTLSLIEEAEALLAQAGL